MTSADSCPRIIELYCPIHLRPRHKMTGMRVFWKERQLFGCRYEVAAAVMERWGVGRRSLVLDNRASAYLGRIFCLAPTTNASPAPSNFCSLSTSFVSGSSMEGGREGRGRRVGGGQQAMGGRRRPVSVAGIRYTPTTCTWHQVTGSLAED